LALAATVGLAFVGVDPSYARGGGGGGHSATNSSFIHFRYDLKAQKEASQAKPKTTGKTQFKDINVQKRSDKASPGM
jgi:type VI protein secretion system component Hcp